MAISVRSEDYIQQLCLVIVAGITCIIGIMIHFFIVGVSVLDWSKGRHLTTADLLITSVGTSRIIFQFASLLNIVWRTFYNINSPAYDITINVFGNSATYGNMWLTVLLSVYYTLKISNFHNDLFLYLKKIISQKVLGLIFVFVLLSIGSSTAGALARFLHAPKNSTQKDNQPIAEVHNIRVTLYIVWNVLPLLCCVVSSVTLLGSLCRHMLRMKRDMNVTSHLDAYFKTIKFTIMSLFCAALFVSINIFGLYCYDSLGIAGVYFVWNCFPILHSVSLIYMTARLRSHFLKTIHGVTKCLLFNIGGEPRSDTDSIPIN